MRYMLMAVLLVVFLPTLAPAMAPTQFGEFSEGYLKRKAERAEKRKARPPAPVAVDPRCDGSGRYQLKAEAYEAGRPDPCVPGATEWVR